MAECLHMSHIRPKFAIASFRMSHSFGTLQFIKTTSMITIRTIFTFLLITITALLTGQKAAAQTCRVAIGSSDGMQTFREVFEYDFVDQKPSFPGGNEAFLDYINKNRKYPADAYKEGIEGRVTCSFIVNADGNISHLKVIKGCHKSLNMEAMRLLAEMPCWLPGKHSSRAVPVRVVHSIPFRK